LKRISQDLLAFAASWVPAAALLATAAWLGSFYGSASFVGLGGLCLLVLALAAGGGSGWLDPLRLGRWGNFLFLLLLAFLVASWVASPVSRAGRTALILVPAFVLLPAAFARCWKDQKALRRGLVGISAAVLVVGLWALFDRAWGGSPRAAMPLGHHRLLASWLVCLLPLACLGARWTGFSRVLAIASGLVGAAAVLLSGSLLGAAALGLEALVLIVVLLGRKGKIYRRGGVFALSAVLLGTILLLGVLPNLDRVRNLASLEDSSMLARSVYWQAGWAGLSERPVLGWGPGATPWTLASFLQPRPGLNPPGELVGDLHNLPLSLAYELGLPSLLLIVVCTILFWRRRWRAQAGPQTTPQTGSAQGLFGAASIGFAAFCLSSLGGAPLGVGALPMALAVVLGAALAGGKNPGEQAPRRRQTQLRWIPAIYALVAFLLLVSPLRGHRAYEVAILESGSLEGGVSEGQASKSAQALRRAVELDPDFPLYQERLALAEGDLLRAWKAASATPGVAGHWLLAGALATETQRSIARGFLGEACRLDPLGAAAPFLLVSVEPGAVEAPAWAARALFAEPRLLASPWWRGREDLLARTIDLVQRQDGVEAGWRLSLQAAARAVEEHLEGPGSDEKDWVRLAVVADSRSGVSFSLHLFRRLPWQQELVTLELDPAALELFEMPAATLLPSTVPQVFQASGCGLGENSKLPEP